MSSERAEPHHIVIARATGEPDVEKVVILKSCLYAVSVYFGKKKIFVP